MFNRLFNYVGLAAAYTRLNFRAQIEYWGAFVSQVAAMFVNDIIWVVFWGLFFTRFKVLHGWDVRDVITVWAIAAAGFGIAHSIFGNAFHLTTLIVQGQLDTWMLYPRALLPHLLLGRMNATAVGDFLFGYAVYVWFVRPDLAHFAMFAILTVSTAIVFLGFMILIGSLTFFLGTGKTLAEQGIFAMITFSTYPSTIFQGAVKVILFTLLPASLVNYLPIEALRALSVGYAALAFVGAFCVLGAGTLLFHIGLKRYESGNLVLMRE